MNEKFINTIKWNEKGLLPCITQQYLTNEILMMAWVNKESLNLKAQIDYHTSFYSSDLRQLGNTSVQLVLGGTVKVGKTFALDLSLSEDIATDTAPDVTFTLGLRRTF